MNTERQKILDYAKVLHEYNKAHENEVNHIDYTAKAHNPYMPSDDKSLNALLEFETSLARKHRFNEVRMMKTEAINLLRKGIKNAN